MIRRPPRSTLFPYTTPLPIWATVSHRFRPLAQCRPKSVGTALGQTPAQDRKSTRLNSSHVEISYAVFCLKKKISTNQSVLQYSTQDQCAIVMCARLLHYVARH